MPGFRATTLKDSKRALEDLKYSIVEVQPQLSTLIQSLDKSGQDARRLKVLKAIEKTADKLKGAIEDIEPKLGQIILTTIRNEVRTGPGVPSSILEKYEKSFVELTSAVEALGKDIGQLTELNKTSS